MLNGSHTLILIRIIVRSVYGRIDDGALRSLPGSSGAVSGAFLGSELLGARLGLMRCDGGVVVVAE